MDISFRRWYPAINQRHSQRQYDATRPVPSETLSALEQLCHEFRPFPEARVELVTNSPDKVFKGVLGPLGKVKGASAYFAFIGNMQNPNIQEITGYTGEGLILESVSLGLGTCWISGMFHPEVAGESAKIQAGERVLAVSPIGYPGQLSGVSRPHIRKPIAQLTSGIQEKDWPDWVKAALESARLAPSAYNRQPWRFQVEPESILISADEKISDRGISKRLDCGIAMMHLELGAMEKGKIGKWELLSPPRIANFEI